MIRHFVLRDLPALHRYRRRGFFLDTTTALTWGPQVVPIGALLTHLAPATGIFTYLSVSDGDPRGLLAQLVHPQNSPTARFSFMAPESAVESDAFPLLLEYLAQEVGERGAHSLVAEVDEGTQAFEVLRHFGFAIYARQRVWHLGSQPAAGSGDNPWRHFSSEDALAVRLLYNSLVPGLTQQVETPPWDRQRGLTCLKEGDLLAYVSLASGPRGVLAQPFFHPDLEDTKGLLEKLLVRIPQRKSRPVFLNVRSYQGWLEPDLEALGAQAGNRQAVMVKRLVAPVKEKAHQPLVALKGTTANPTMPIARASINREMDVELAPENQT